MVSISFISIFFFCFERKFFLKFFFFKQGISSRFEKEAMEYSLAIQNRKTAQKRENS